MIQLPVKFRLKVPLLGRCCCSSRSIINGNSGPSQPAHELREVELERSIEQVEQGIQKPSVNDFAGLLQAACRGGGSLVLVKRLHSAIALAGMNGDMFLANHIIDAYGRCGCLGESQATFDSMRERNVFSWTVLITAYARHGHCSAAIRVFEGMQQEGIKPNQVTLVSVLNALNSPSMLHRGRQLHAHVKEMGEEPDDILNNAIVCMYGKCGSLEEARQVFDKSSNYREARDEVASWNGLLTIHIQQGEVGEALRMYKRMKHEGIPSNKVTFVTILNACEVPHALPQGRLVHAHVFEAGFDQDLVVSNALLTMYTKCGSLKDALNKFESMQVKNVISWSAMLGAYAAATSQDYQHEQEENDQAAAEAQTEGMRLFHMMHQEGVKPNDITFASVLSLCHNLESARSLHSCIVEAGFLDGSVVIGSSLIGMYTRCGSLEDAASVFGNMVVKNTVTWTSMIAAYGLYGHTQDGFQLFRYMQLEGVKPDKITFITLLDLCSTKASLAHGKFVHKVLLADASGHRLDGNLGNAVLNMYGKCGSMDNARRIFDALPGGHVRVSCWNALVAAYAQYGHVKEALDTLVEMIHEGVRPDSVTFTSILAACSHVGSVNKSHGYFISMTQDHGLRPCTEHYGCLVDVLCRAGRLAQAEAVIEEVDFASGSVVSWLTLLSACKLHKDVLRSRKAAAKIVELDPGSSSVVYSLLRGICGAAENEDDNNLQEQLELSIHQ